jgi:hypothetical protein
MVPGVFTGIVAGRIGPPVPSLRPPEAAKMKEVKIPKFSSADFSSSTTLHK